MIIGIDPDTKGAICFLQDDGKILSVDDMPCVEIMVGKTLRRRVSPQDLSDLLLDHAPEMVVIEKVQGMTGQSASAAFTFGYGAGMVMGIVVAHGYPTTLLPPQRWKKAFNLPKDKGAARQRAQQLWPESASLFARQKDHGRAEAALIARHYYNCIPRAAG